MTPDYYLLPNGGDVWDLLTDEEKKGFAKGSILKYICRMGKKNGEAEIKELEKVIDYAQKLKKVYTDEARNNAKAKTYEVEVNYTDGTSERLTLKGIDEFDAECQAAKWYDRHKVINSIGEAKEVKDEPAH